MIPGKVSTKLTSLTQYAGEPYDAITYMTFKRNDTAKNRVVVDGSKQHSDTYTDTISPVASQLQLRLFLAVSAFRLYDMAQSDLTNAYLHAPILVVVYIYISEGFPGQGEIARLRKAAY